MLKFIYFEKKLEKNLHISYFLCNFVSSKQQSKKKGN